MINFYAAILIVIIYAFLMYLVSTQLKWLGKVTDWMTKEQKAILLFLIGLSGLLGSVLVVINIIPSNFK